MLRTGKNTCTSPRCASVRPGGDARCVLPEGHAAAHIADGAEWPSEASAAVDDPSLPLSPAAPTNFAQVSVTSTTAQVSWTDNASDETAYEVEYKLASDGSWTLWSDAIAADAETTVITGLTAGSLYDVRIRATNGSGDSSWLTGQFTTTAATTALIDYHFATATSLPAGITFSRASAATMFDSAGLIKSVASGTARIGYGSVGGRKGLLVEGARTNLCLRSEEFDNAAWRSDSLANPPTTTANSGTAPDGSTTADTATFGDPQFYFRQRVTGLTNGATYTFSVWVKAAPSGGASFFRLTTNNTVTWNTGGSTRVAIDSNWQRVSVTWTQSGTSAFLLPGRVQANGSQDATCDGSVLLWGAQLELGSFPSTYIPTEGSTASRAGDRAYLTLSPAMAAALSNGGTMAVEYSLMGGDSTKSSSGRAYGSVDDGTGNERVFIYNANGNSAGLIIAGGVTQALAQIVGTIAVDDPQAAAVSWALNSVNFAQGGVAATRDTSATMPTVTAIGIGALSSSSSSAYAVIHRIRVWTSPSDDTRLEDLAELSSPSTGGQVRTSLSVGLTLGL